MAGKRLQRQLKSIFGDEAIGDRLRMVYASAAKGDAKGLEELKGFIENLPSFLSAVDMYYDQLDDRALLAQQSAEMSENELAENHVRLTQLNQLFETMVNSLGQGFFLFDRDGFCLSTYSKACESLLECNPAGLHLAETLRVAADKRETFCDWIRLLFEDVIEFGDLIDVAPKLFPNTQQRVVSLEYKPVRNSDGKLEMVVVIATDRTAESKAKRDAKKMEAFATLMVSILKDKERFRRFVAAARQIFREIYVSLKSPEFNFERLSEVKRNLHTLKGAAAAFGVAQVSDEVHTLEAKLNDESDIKKVKFRLMTSVPEIDRMFEGLLDEYREVIAEFLDEREPSRTVPIATLEEFAARIKKLGPEGVRLHYDFMEEVVAVPMRRIFGEFDSAMQQVATKLGKKVAPMKFIGDEVSVMPESIDAFRASLIHIFRNIVDHGIESEIIRDQRGKPPAGQVVVEFRSLASSLGKFLRIIISDDGNGIDIWQIRMKMERQGVETNGLSNKQLLGKIFDTGFTTASAVTEFSGRGVGLDAVRVEVERLGGSISVRSELGRGSAFIIELPLDESGNFFSPRPTFGAA